MKYSKYNCYDFFFNDNISCINMSLYWYVMSLKVILKLIGYVIVG